MTPADRWPDGDPDERAFASDFRDPIASLEARTKGCPPLDLLLAADAGVLPDPTRREVDEHRQACVLCQQLLRDVRDAGLGEPIADDIARLRSRIDSARGQRARPHRGWSRSTALALAASLAAVAVTGGWALWLFRQNQLLQGGANQAPQANVAQLQTELDAERARRQVLEGQIARLETDATSPVVDVPLVDLEPVDALRGGTVPVVQVPASARLLMLILATSTRSAGREYDIEILDARNQVTWQGTGLKATSLGTVTLVVPRSVMPPGQAIVRLYTRAGSSRTLAHEYAVRLDVAP
jgi:hypothetical protein